MFLLHLMITSHGPCSSTKCSTDMMMLNNILFVLNGTHIFQYYSITQKCRDLTLSTFVIKQHTDVFIFYNDIQMLKIELKNI